jgi:hypothetical protein
MSSVRPARGSGAEIYVKKDPTAEALRKQMHAFWNEQSCDTQAANAATRKHTYTHDAKRPLLTGNPLGLFHCISAEKNAGLENRP